MFLHTCRGVCRGSSGAAPPAAPTLDGTPPRDADRACARPCTPWEGEPGERVVASWLRRSGPFWRRAIGCPPLAILLATLTACDHPRAAAPRASAARPAVRQAAQRPRREVIVCIDTSDGWFPYNRDRAEAMLSQVADSLDTSQDVLVIYRLDCELQRVYCGPPPDDDDALQEVLKHGLTSKPLHARTYPALFWRAAADKVHDDGNMSGVDIMYFGDCDDDSASPTSGATIKQAVQTLAAAPNLRYVGVYGTTERNAETLYRQFKPLDLAGRFHVYTPGWIDLEPALNALTTSGGQP